MHRLSELHLSHIFRKKPSGLMALEANYLLVKLATSMVSGFGVIFLYEFGSTFIEGMLWVVGFFLLQRIMTLISLNVSAEAVGKYGYRKVMLLAVVLMVIKLWLLSVATTQNPIYLVFALICGGISLSSYSLVFHGMFLDDNDDDRIGEQMGLITMLGRASGIVAPFLAGLIIDQHGFTWMFLVSMLILLLSSIPLWLMPHHKHRKSSYSFGKSISMIKKDMKLSTSAVLWYVSDGIQWAFWPLYMFFVVKSYTAFGVIGSLVMILNSVAVYFAGKIYDKRPLRRGFSSFGVLVSISWILRFLSKNTVSIFTAESLNRIFSPLWWMKIRKEEIERGEHFDTMTFAVSHELLVIVGYLIALILGGLMVFMGRFGWYWLMGIAVISTLLSSAVIVKRK